ncbi:unnamed protein product [Linum trigynum]|uniref:Uncharacterized protein n=1 Tax=Linum trigynum TaxID=586398 RepID=A0AAV2F8S6_9ROSI
MINKPPASVPRLDSCRSMTRQETLNFWRQKLIVQEHNLIDAFKAAANTMALHLTCRRLSTSNSRSCGRMMIVVV